MTVEGARVGFAGLRVAAFESRLAEQMRQLIERYGGRPLVAPSMREVPLEGTADGRRFGERLLAGEFEMVLLLTGVGTRFMLKVLDSRWPREQTLAALGKTILVARGPKPIAVLREQGMQPTIAVPEPNTWRDLVKALDDQGRPLKGMSVAVQEYGVTNVELLKALEERGAIVTRVPVYQWRLPEDTGPLTAAVRALMQGEADVVLFTNAVQVDHVMQMAERLGGADRLRAALSEIVVSAAGPIVAERLCGYELSVDSERSHREVCSR